MTLKDMERQHSDRKLSGKEKARNMSIKYKIASMTVLVALIPIVLLTVLMLFFYNRAILQRADKQIEEFDIVIALSKAEDITEVKRAYEKAMGFAISKGQGRFIDLRQEADTSVFSSMEAIFRLNKDIENLQAEDAENVINSIWDKIHENNAGKENIQISDMNILTSIISVLMTNIINSGFSVEKIYGEAFSPESFFAGSKNPDDMKDKVIYLFQKRIEFEKGKKESKSRDVALSAKEYIENNYKNSELSIADISEVLCVNQTYLRKMFKSEMDMTLSEYITQVRMQEAKRLITTTDEKLSTVAENVGYGDVSYFSNVFKKFYGISPRSMCKE